MTNKETVNTIFPLGDLIDNDNFSGKAWLSMLNEDEQYHCPIGNVTFEPRCRNRWHIHPGGQILLVTSGKGWYQEEGKNAQIIQEGDTIKIPPNVKHWHGACKESYLSHLAITTNAEQGIVEWLEMLDEDAYDAL